MLVGARWLAGMLFRWSDLEILDDPIPEKLYCQHFRSRNHQPGLADLEEAGNGEDHDLDTKPEGMYIQCTLSFPHSFRPSILPVLVLAPFPSLCSLLLSFPSLFFLPSPRSAASNGTHAPPSKRKSDINITQAVDNTGIWKNMVRKLDAPLQSPHRRGRFKPTSLNPIIVEEESDLISPRSPHGNRETVVTAEAAGNSNSADDIDDGATSSAKSTRKAASLPTRGLQVTSV